LFSVYLSPSQQRHNKGVGNYGTENVRMQQIAYWAAKKLTDLWVTVYVAPASWSQLPESEYLARVVAASNSLHADAHVAIHSNAGPTGADGTDTFYYGGSAKGRKLAIALQNAVAPVSPGSDSGIHAKSGWAELDRITGPSALIEVAYHTDKADAASVVKDPKAYGDALAEGIINFLGVSKPTSKVPLQAKVVRGLFKKLPTKWQKWVIKWAPKWRSES